MPLFGSDVRQRLFILSFFISCKCRNFVANTYKKMKATKLLKYDKLDSLMLHRQDDDGSRKTFYLKYVEKSGTIIEADNVVCTSVDRKRSTRRVKFLDSADASGNAQTRTLRDILILQVDEYKIIKN